MRDDRTILGSLLDTTIRVGRLNIPARSIENVLSRYTSPACFHYEASEFGLTEEYGISVHGSVTKVKFKDRFFAIISRHQVNRQGWNMEQFCLFDEVSKRTVSTGHQAFFVDLAESPDSDLDLCMFEFTELVAQGSLPATNWFDVASDMNRFRPPKPIFACAIGYPLIDNWIDFESKVFRVRAYSVLGKEVASEVSGRLSFIPVTVLDFDPNGLSGSPVFCVYQDGNAVCVSLAGIVTHMSKSIVNFVSFTRVKQLINYANSKIG